MKLYKYGTYSMSKENTKYEVEFINYTFIIKFL